MNVPQEERNTRHSPLWTRSFLLLFVYSFLSNAGFFMTMPVLPRYAVELGMSLAETGILTGIFSIVAIVARPAAGIISDRFPKKRMLILFSAAVGAAAFCYGLCTKPLGLYVFRILHGAAYAISSTIQIAMTTEMIRTDRMGEGMSMMSMAQVLAMSIAPNLGLTLSQRAGNRTALYLSGGLILGALVCAVLLPAERKAAPDRESGTPGAGRVPAAGFSLKRMFAVELMLLAVISGLFSLMNGVTSSYLSMLGDERSIEGIGIFFTISSVAVLLIRPFAGKLMDRRGLACVLIPSLVFGSVAMLCIGAARALPAVILAAVLKGVGQSAGQSSVQAECAKRSRPEKRGVAMSTCYLGSDLGNSAGAGLGGYLSGAYGYGVMFKVAGVIIASGLGLYAVQRRIDKGRKG